MYCRPASQFCCGFPLEVGVWLILIGHFLFNIYWVVSSVTMMYDLQGKTNFITALTTHCLVAAFCLVGIPLVLLAMWGMRRKQEVPINIYWYYLALSMIVDVGAIFWSLVIHGPCEMMPMMGMQGGRAFACGAARMANGVVIVSLLGLQGYILFVVASYCEDLSMCGGPDLSELKGAYRNGRSVITKNAAHHMNYGIMGDHLHSHRPGDWWAENVGSLSQAGATSHVEKLYGGAAMSGLGGSRPIFGSEHVMAYPPPAS